MSNLSDSLLVTLANFTTQSLIEYINSHEGVEWMTMGEMCDYFKSKNPVPEGAILPATPEEVMKMLDETKPKVE